MTFPSADQMLERLKERANLLRFERNGAVPIWFSTQIPADLPIGTNVRKIALDNIALQHNHYHSVNNELSGWMTYWWHRGGHSFAATAFITIASLNTSTQVVEIDFMSHRPAQRMKVADDVCTALRLKIT